MQHFRPETPDEWWDYEGVVLVDGELRRPAAPDPLEPLVQRVAERVFVVLEQRQQEPTASLLVDADEAARLLGITRDALDKRVQRNQVSGVVRTGRRIQFNREKLQNMKNSPSRRRSR